MTKLQQAAELKVPDRLWRLTRCGIRSPMLTREIPLGHQRLGPRPGRRFRGGLGMGEHRTDQ